MDLVLDAAGAALLPFLDRYDVAACRATCQFVRAAIAAHPWDAYSSIYFPVRRLDAWLAAFPRAQALCILWDCKFTPAYAVHALPQIRLLRVGYSALGPDGYDLLLALLRLVPNLTCLFLPYLECPASMLHVIADVFRHIPRLTSLEVSSRENVHILLAAMTHLPRLERLKFAFDLGPREAAHALHTSLALVPQLVELRLRGWVHVQEVQLKALTLLPKLTTLQMLCDLGPRGRAAVAGALRCLPQLTVLELALSSRYDDGMAEIASALAYLPRLTDVHLSYIGEHGARALAASLRQCVSLTTLHLDFCKAGVASPAALSLLHTLQDMPQLAVDLTSLLPEFTLLIMEELPRLCRLKVLQLSADLFDGYMWTLPSFDDTVQQHMWRRAVVPVVDTLAQAPSLTELKVLSAHGVVTAVTSALAYMPQLQLLDLHSCAMGDDGLCALAAALVHIPMLTQLSLADNKITGADAIRALAAGLRHTPRLEVLDIQWNSLRAFAMYELLRAMKRLPCLRALWLVVRDAATLGQFRKVVPRGCRLNRLH